MNYREYLKKTFDAELPGRKSRARQNFEQFGIIPHGVKGVTKDMLTEEIHKEILSALAASDNHLRQGDLKWFNEHEAKSPADKCGAPILHTEESLTVESKSREERNAAVWDEIKTANDAIVRQKAAEMEARFPSLQKPVQKRSFMGEVSKLKEAGLSTTDAMQRVVREYPELHAEYLETPKR